MGPIPWDISSLVMDGVAPAHTRLVYNVGVILDLQPLLEDQELAMFKTAFVQINQMYWSHLNLDWSHSCLNYPRNGLLLCSLHGAVLEGHLEGITGQSG